MWASLLDWTCAADGAAAAASARIALGVGIAALEVASQIAVCYVEHLFSKKNVTKPKLYLR